MSNCIETSKNRDTRFVIHIVGEGMTELYYFKHLKRLFNFRYTISPRFFNNNCIDKLAKKIKELLAEEVFVICIFDADVSRRNQSENTKLENLKKKYEKNKNVLLCESLQSIEYWFLLHYKDTSKHFEDAKATEKELKKYLKTYDKSEKFLENEKWVNDMSLDGRFENAYNRAKRHPEGQSFSLIHKAIAILNKVKIP